MSWINRKTFQNIGLLLGALLVGLIFAELTLRLFWSLVEPKTIAVSQGGEDIRPDPILQSVLVPGGWNGSIDKNGFSNAEVKASYDVVALGDSHTGGTTTSWPREFERKTGLPTYNMGVPGYGPVQYAALFDKALSFHPKTIVVAFYLGNDVFNAYDVVYHLDYWKTARAPGFADDHPASTASLKMTHVPLRAFRDWIRGQSKLYAFLGDRTRIWREELGWATPRNIGTKDWSDTDPDVSLRFDSVASQQTLFWVSSRARGVDLDDKNIIEGLRLSKVFLSEMEKKAETHNTRLVVAFIPSKDSVYAHLIGDEGKKSPIYSKIIIDEARIQTMLLEYCAREKISCFSMLPSLEAKLEAGQVLYKQNWDEHPASLGYEAYADAVIEYLKKEKI